MSGEDINRWWNGTDEQIAARVKDVADRYNKYVYETAKEALCIYHEVVGSRKTPTMLPSKERHSSFRDIIAYIKDRLKLIKDATDG